MFKEAEKSWLELSTRSQLSIFLEENKEQGEDIYVTKKGVNAEAVLRTFWIAQGIFEVSILLKSETSQVMEDMILENSL